MEGVIQAISTHCTTLETLIMSGCGLQDTHMIGANDIVAGEIYRCLPQGVKLIQNIPNPSVQDLDQAVYPFLEVLEFVGPRQVLSGLRSKSEHICFIRENSIPLMLNVEILFDQI